MVLVEYISTLTHCCNSVNDRVHDETRDDLSNRHAFSHVAPIIKKKRYRACTLYKRRIIDSVKNIWWNTLGAYRAVWICAKFRLSPVSTYRIKCHDEKTRRFCWVTFNSCEILEEIVAHFAVARDIHIQRHIYIALQIDPNCRRNRDVFFSVSVLR